MLEVEPSYELAVRNDSDQGSVMFGPWIRLSLDTTMLAVEAQTVIGLRLMMLGSGGAAARAEAHRKLTGCSRLPKDLCGSSATPSPRNHGHHGLPTRQRDADFPCALVCIRNKATHLFDNAKCVSMSSWAVFQLFTGVVDESVLPI